MMNSGSPLRPSKFFKNHHGDGKPQIDEFQLWPRSSVERIEDKNITSIHSQPLKQRSEAKHDTQRIQFKTIEVAPGMHMRLRGAEETCEAVRTNRCVESTCLLCAGVVLCIESADHVLCPQCKVVSPVKEKGTTLKVSAPSVGLGITLEQFSEIVSEMEDRETSTETSQLLFFPHL